jgi:folate-dependent phosphoribosylglycinamide formyltransferase PurN
MNWTTFFSQTGTEIVEISTALNRWPDIICTNKSIKDLEQINPILLENCFSKMLFLKDRPTVEEYNTALRYVRKQANIITLNGYLRIIPQSVCNQNRIYNGHPGDIVNYPILKGYNPQEKAFKLKIKDTGSVIHVVTQHVDEGAVIAAKKCSIDLRSLEKTYNILHKNSIKLWVEFLSDYLNIKK